MAFQLNENFDGHMVKPSWCYFIERDARMIFPTIETDFSSQNNVSTDRKKIMIVVTRKSNEHT